MRLRGEQPQPVYRGIAYETVKHVLDTITYAINAALRQQHYPFSALQGSANVLIFPNLHAANIGYRLLSELSEGEIIGPILTGMQQPVCVLSQESLVQDVVNMTALSVVEAEEGVI